MQRPLLSDVSGVVGTDVDMRIGGELLLRGGGNVDAVTTGEVGVWSERLSVDTSEGLSASSAGDISVSGVSGVSVSSGGSVVRLSDEGGREYVGYAIESSGSFDEFEQVFESGVSDVDELIVVSESETAVATGAGDVSIEVYDDSSSEWVRVTSARETTASAPDTASTQFSYRKRHRPNLTHLQIQDT